VSNPQSSSFWAYKPWWCQPWSIILTGVSAVGGIAGLSHNLWLTLAVGILISFWWFVFLFSVPRLFQEQQLATSDLPKTENTQ